MQRADLAASSTDCTLAMWHHPVFNSGTAGNRPQMREVWRLLHTHGAGIVLSGDEHACERFGPQDADGKATPCGLRAFVVGTGGYSLHGLGRTQPKSEAWENRTSGVLKLVLRSGSYEWQFVPVAGQTYADSGSGRCVAPSTF